MLRNYRIIKKIGKGGQGTVFLAKRISDLKQVAIKSIDLSNPVSRKSFESECAVLNALYNDKACEPNHILCIIESFVDHERNFGYIVTDYYENSVELFTYIIDEGHVLSETQFLDLTKKLLIALKYIHDNGMIHMDVKPENILVIKQPNITAKLRVILLDFGLTCAKETCSKVGTDNFIAPEVYIKTMPITEKADVFGLGITLFCVVEKYYPYDPDKVTKWVKSRPHSLEINPYPEFDMKFQPWIKKYPFLLAMVNPNPEKRKSVDELLLQVDQMMESKKYTTV